MFRNKYRFAITIIFVLFLSFACDDDKSFTPAEDFDAGSLLGLVDGKSFTYIKTDTVITAEPYSVDVTESNIIISISGQGSDWIIHNGSTPIANLKITNPSIIQNGYWRESNNLDTLIYFAAPPVIMNRTLNTSDEWIYYTPKYKSDLSEDYLFFYSIYFGFTAEKVFVGIEEIITPAGSFNAYRFDVSLYANIFDTAPSATVEEYYYPNVGLVKLNLSAGPLKRSLNLISYTNAR